MRDISTITRALADEARLRALAALTRGELCVCQITELLCLAPSTVSRHLSILSHAGLVEQMRRGRWVYYRLAPRTPEAKGALRWLEGAFRKSAAAKGDAARLARILKSDPEELCRRQAERRR